MGRNNHPGFQKRLLGSEDDRQFLANYFWSFGDTVEMDPLRVAPTADRHAEYADHGDMLVHFKLENPHRKAHARLESKRRVKIPFTCQRDFPYRNMVVCACDSFQRLLDEGRKPFAFIQLNSLRTHVAVIKIWTQATWRVQEIEDKERGSFQKCWCVPLSEVIFVPLARLREILLAPEKKRSYAGAGFDERDDND